MAFPNAPVTSLNTLTGDPTVDALVMLAAKWGGAVGTGAALTYSFPQWTASSTPVFDDYPADSEPSAAYSPSGLNATQQEVTLQALVVWSNVADIAYTRVEDTAAGYGDIRFAVTTKPGAGSAWARYPMADASAGDVWLTPSMNLETDWSAGSQNSWLLIHEVGHTLGLRHPFDYAPGLPADLNHRGFTAMAYNAAPHSMVFTYRDGGYTGRQLQPDGPMVGDIEAIQYLYGANATHHAGADTYRYDDTKAIFHTIWDAGGNDTISLDNFSKGSTLDLRPGHYSNLGMRVWLPGELPPLITAADVYDGTGALAIAYNVTIENAIGGSGNDYLIGNDANNSLTGGRGDDALEGLTGVDTAVYSGVRANYVLGTDGENRTLSDTSGNDGRDVLARVERLQFADKAVAIDLDGNAGAVAKILGAVFGVDAVTNPMMVGLGLKFADSGLNFKQLTQLALDHSSLSAAASDAALVSGLYSNVIGVAPTAQQQAGFVGMLADHTYDRPGLAVMAAQAAENAGHIGLTGLAASGLEYVLQLG